MLVLLSRAHLQPAGILAGVNQQRFVTGLTFHSDDRRRTSAMDCGGLTPPFPAGIGTSASTKWHDSR